MRARTAVKAARPALLLPGGIALLAGVDAALLLADLPAPVTSTRLPDVHGVLLTLGFVGTLIALERAVALDTWWAYAAPGLLGAGALLTISPVPLVVSRWLLVAGMLVLLAIYRGVWRRQPEPPLLVQAGGAALGVASAVLWLGGVAVPLLVPWLAGFLVLTIAGERLELAAVSLAASASPSARTRFLVACAALFVAPAAALLWPAAGYPLLGAALLTVVGWLLHHDVARRTVRGSGVTRYMAVNLLLGYAWLAVAGSVWVLAGRVLDGAGYDAVVHAVFLGFVLSMIMGHAPVILPAVTGRPLPYRPYLLVPVVLLQLSLLVRTVLGDLRGLEAAWQLGSALNVASVLLFAVLAAVSAATAGSGQSGASRRVIRHQTTSSTTDSTALKGSSVQVPTS